MDLSSATHCLEKLRTLDSVAMQLLILKFKHNYCIPHLTLNKTMTEP